VIARFIVHVEERRKTLRTLKIFAADETSVEFDCPADQVIDTRGVRDVRSTDNFIINV
jgi:hypothetical protein